MNKYLEQLNNAWKQNKEEHYDGYRCRCGCSIKTPHSHLVYGQSCECEKGDQLSIKENPITYF